jgi:hypothetical protein
MVGIGALVTSATAGVVGLATNVARGIHGEHSPDTTGMSPLAALATRVGDFVGDVPIGVGLLGEAASGLGGVLVSQPLNVAALGVERLRDTLAHEHGIGTPTAPAPTIADLRDRFPDAGLPERMVGTTIDDSLVDRYDGNLDALMQQVADLGMNTVRVGAYWDDIQPNGAGDADFDQLDRVLDAADRAGLRVVLTVGAKAPAWPEFHVPKWAAPASGDPEHDATFQQRSLEFVRLVAAHTAAHPALAMWQVENEPFDLAGPDRWRLDPAAVAREADALRAADGHRHPVLVNNWSESDRDDELASSFDIGDAVGIDVYPDFPNDNFDLDRAGRVVGTPHHALDLARATGKPALVTELQADDWDPYRVTADDVRETTDGLVDMGYRDILFWRQSELDDDAAAGDTSLAQLERTYAHDWLGESTGT